MIVYSTSEEKKFDLYCESKGCPFKLTYTYELDEEGSMTRIKQKPVIGRRNYHLFSAHLKHARKATDKELKESRKSSKSVEILPDESPEAIRLLNDLGLDTDKFKIKKISEKAKTKFYSVALSQMVKEGMQF